MHWFRKKNSKGFTMIELMVVVVIVGVLATIAIPIYGKYIKNARVSEATGKMGEVITAAKAWAQEHQAATSPYNPTWPPAAGGGLVDLTATENFTYTISAGGAADATTSTLTITATGRAKMQGVSVAVSVPNIKANGLPPVVSGL